MFFGFTDEEKMIRKSVKEMLKDNSTTEYVREFMKNPSISKDMQHLLANQGLFGIIDFTGDDEYKKGMINAILVAQEAGRHLLTFPLLETMVATATLKTCIAQTDKVDEIEAGAKTVTVAWTNVDAKVRKSEEGFVLNGRLKEVPFAKDVDYIVANVRVAGYGNTSAKEETIVVIDAKNPKISVENAHSIDETYPLYEVNVANYIVEKEDVVQQFGMGTGHQLMKRMKQVATLLLAAELVGCAERALYETVDYSKQREQFGVLIGSFQALKHMAADMYVKVESAKVAVEYAAWAVNTDSNDADVAVSIAKSYASDASILVCGHAIQMHGGIGYTWENNMHLFFKRARRSAALLGTSYSHREKIAKTAIDGVLNKEENKIEKKREEYVQV